MGYLIRLKKISDTRGKLIAIEDELPFIIKRVFYVFDVPANTTRGGHRHKATKQALICINGECVVHLNNGHEKKSYKLNNSDSCLIVEPEDFHTMSDFTPQSVLLVLASTKYDSEDYIFNGYEND